MVRGYVRLPGWDTSYVFGDLMVFVARVNQGNIWKLGKPQGEKTLFIIFYGMKGSISVFFARDTRHLTS